MEPMGLHTPLNRFLNAHPRSREPAGEIQPPRHIPPLPHCLRKAIAQDNTPGSFEGARTPQMGNRMAPVFPRLFSEHFPPNLCRT